MQLRLCFLTVTVEGIQRSFLPVNFRPSAGHIGIRHFQCTLCAVDLQHGQIGMPDIKTEIQAYNHTALQLRHAGIMGRCLHRHRCTLIRAGIDFAVGKAGSGKGTYTFEGAQ